MTSKIRHSKDSTQPGTKAAGRFKINFGRYRGRRLNQVPTGYLQWALSCDPRTSSFCKLQDAARAYLGRHTPQLRREGEATQSDWLNDPLSREFLAIVRSS